MSYGADAVPWNIDLVADFEFAHWPAYHEFSNCVFISISFALTLGSMLAPRMFIHVDTERAGPAWITWCAALHAIYLMIP
jgi:hypothetical protein